MCVAVDTNCMVEMQIERVSEAAGPATEALNLILAATYLALDSGMHCQQEWFECMPGPYGEEVKSWLDQLIVHQKIRYLDIDACPHLMKTCGHAGLPNKDKKWIKLCAHDCVKFLVTEDIDFFDPSLKSAKSTEKTKLKQKLGGKMRQLIRKETGVEVICIHHVPNFI